MEKSPKLNSLYQEITAAKIINITKACRLYCLKSQELSNLISKEINKTGKRKTIPFAKHTVVTVEIRIEIDLINYFRTDLIISQELNDKGAKA